MEKLQDIVNALSRHIPKGFVISICIEDGEVWVQLKNSDSEYVDRLPSQNRTLLEQLNNALCIALGWGK